MSEPPEYASKAALLRNIAEFFYGSRQGDPIPLDDVYVAFPGEREGLIDWALKKMDAFELVSLQLKKPLVGMLGFGKSCFEQDCIPELILGPDYVSKKYRSAVVHIIVEGRDGESGGTGFFWADHANQIVTDAHVVRDRKILRIEDCYRNPIRFDNGAVRIPSDDLDLAVLECEMPGSIEPIKVEWRLEAAAPGVKLIALGYPKIALHHASLSQSSAELHSISQKYSSSRDSLLISGTQPGYSGGPVIDLRGFAIGVIEQENTFEHKGGMNAFFSATPTYYLRELVPPTDVN